MFSLNLPTEPYWIDLPHDVRVRVKPLDAVVSGAARSRAVREIAEMMRERAERSQANVPADGLLDVDDENIRETLVKLEFARGLARYGMIGWEGVGDDAGAEPLAFTPDLGEALATHPDMIEAFLAAYLSPLARVIHEGNALPTTPDGSSAVVGTIAADVTPSAPTAQEP